MLTVRGEFDDLAGLWLCEGVDVLAPTHPLREGVAMTTMTPPSTPSTALHDNTRPLPSLSILTYLYSRVNHLYGQLIIGKEYRLGMLLLSINWAW